MSNNQYDRNYELDLIKFISCLVIIFYHHSGKLMKMVAPGGYVFVELFFMISGYFLMKNVNSVKTEVKAGCVSINYMGKKIRHIYPFFCVHH